MNNNRKNDRFESRFNEESDNFFEDEENEGWKEKVIDKAEGVASDLEEEIQEKRTQTEKNLEAFRKERGKKEEGGFSDFSSGLEKDSRRTERDKFSLDEGSEEDWKEEIDAPTFIIFTVEIVLLTYFILAVLGYVPFF